MKIFENAIKTYTEVYGTENHVDIAKIYTLIGEVHHQNRNPEQAILHMESALKIYSILDKIDSRTKQKKIYKLLGSLCKSKKTIEYLDKYLQISGLSTDAEAQGNLYLSVVIEFRMNNLPIQETNVIFTEMTWKSKRYYEEAIKLYQSQQSIQNDLKLARVFEHIGDLLSNYKSCTNHDFDSSDYDPAIWWAKAIHAANGKAIHAANGNGDHDLKSRCEDKLKNPDNILIVLDNGSIF